MSNGGTIKERLAKLETMVGDIMNNHLAHIDKKIERVQKKQDKITWLIITTLITIILVGVEIYFKM